MVQRKPPHMPPQACALSRMATTRSPERALQWLNTILKSRNRVSDIPSSTNGNDVYLLYQYAAWSVPDTQVGPRFSICRYCVTYPPVLRPIFSLAQSEAMKCIDLVHARCRMIALRRWKDFSLAPHDSTRVPCPCRREDAVLVPPGTLPYSAEVNGVPYCCLSNHA